MINFITSLEDIQEENVKLTRVFKKEIVLPRKMFTDDFIFFLSFEFDLIYDKIMYEGLKLFLNRINEKQFTLYTLKPSPEDYFFKHFNKYSVTNVSLECSYSEYIEFLEQDPGNSPADALRFNSELFIYFSNNPNWGLICDKDWEIGIIGFTQEKFRNEFVDSFKDKNIFSSVEDRVSTINKILNLKEDAKEFYSELISNYSKLS